VSFYFNTINYNSSFHLVGPFIIYEYCKNGQLSEYLQNIKDLTLEENERLQRFGLGVARGMEHLAQRKVLLLIICFGEHKNVR
jgi:hypothetical protein